ncbi:MAG TPA: hypothetical protein O0X39_04435 [Methanocorpusculum sp.]|nr:hypothetical protein [Methanocorpusculum sp.]
MAKTGSSSNDLPYQGRCNSNIFQYRYGTEGLIIDAYIRKIAGLYITETNLDFGEAKPEFDPEVVKYMIQDLLSEKYLKSGSVSIVFHLAPAVLENARYQNIKEDFHSSLLQISPLIKNKLHQANVENIRSTIFGFASLVICLGVAEILLLHFDKVGLIVGISQGLSVVGWVILWRPVDYFIFERRASALSFRWLKKLFTASIKTTKWDGKLGSDLLPEKMDDLQ